jgi:hypothetical protein
MLTVAGTALPKAGTALPKAGTALPRAGTALSGFKNSSESGAGSAD